MRRSTATVPTRSPRRAGSTPRSAALRPPVGTPREPKPVSVPAAPYVTSVDEDLECCLLGIKDCLKKMRQTEVTFLCMRALERVLDLLPKRR